MFNLGINKITDIEYKDSIIEIYYYPIGKSKLITFGWNANSETNLPNYVIIDSNILNDEYLLAIYKYLDETFTNY